VSGVLMLSMLTRLGARAVALALLATMAIIPPAMVLARAPQAAPAPAQHAGQHHPGPGQHHLPLDGTCCDLCLTSCVACGGLVGSVARDLLLTAQHLRAAVVVVRAFPLHSPPDHKLPFALGPPVLLA
jgi:hypothetical protein